MAWMSSTAVQIVGSDLWRTLTSDDLDPDYEFVLACGWAAVDDAILLNSLYESYHGDRGRFTETIDYEVAVNGRGIPDLDLVEEGGLRVSQLLRRGAAFAWAALHEQYRQLPDVEMGAYVSAAPVLLDPDQFTGNVTFCAMRSGRPPYIDPARLADEIVVAIFTEDCRNPLPVSRERSK